MEDILEESIVHLGCFAKVGFFSTILSGSKPQQQFNQLDADLTVCLNELSMALQVTQLNEQAQTYKVVCDIQAKIDSHGGLQGVYSDPQLLQSLADEIGSDVADLKAEVKDSLDRIEATVNQVDVNVQIMLSEMDGLKRELLVFMTTQTTASGKLTPADQASLTLSSTPVINYSKVLGQGSFGTVYEGTYDNAFVAVKVITVASILTTAQMNELSREVLMHSKVCNLPGVVRLFGANLSTEPRCVVLELADGSLHDVLHKRSPAIDLSMTSKLSLAVQISAAMGCISEMGIIHRDIKSSNVLIFLQSQGRVSAKLADFGLAKVNTENTYATSQTPKGTPPYMAPELFQGQYSSASDVYAFAVMLNEVLLEEVPFASASLHEIMMKVVTHKGRPRAYSAPVADPVGCRLMSLVSTCWNQDPQLRMSFQALASDLSQLLSASVEIARNGTISAGAGTTGGPTTPLSPHTPEAAITAITEWLTTACNLLPYDSTSLAHTLVTTKCITSVAALDAVVIHNSELLTHELRIAKAYDIQIKKALHQQRKVELQLKDLSVEQVCLLLESQNLHSIKPIVVANNISGTLLGTGFDSVDELKEIGIVAFQAKALFKLINEWNAHGLPAAFLQTLTAGSSTLAPPGTTLSPAIQPPTPALEIAANGNGSGSMDGGPSPLPSKVAAVPSAVLSALLDKLYIAARFRDDAKAFAQLLAAADSGNQLAEAYLSIIYTAGGSVQTKDIAKAVGYATKVMPWLQAEVSTGNTYAMYVLGWLFSQGAGVTKDEQQAVRLWTMAAEQGHPTAQFSLGVSYANGTGVTKDEQEAVRWYTLAAKLGDAQAQFNLGLCYDYGTGVIKDEKEAVRWYTQAAEQGYAKAQFNLGLCYSNGTGVTKDEKEAVRLYTLAAEQRHAQAQFSLGVRYANGTGVTKDEKEAVRWYTLAAKQGHTAASAELSALLDRLYIAARFRDDATAFAQLLAAVDGGNQLAEAYLSIIYTAGGSVQTKDIAKAVDYATKVMPWLQAEVQTGNTYAMYVLGWLQGKGTGVDKDEQEAVRLWTLAAKQGHLTAQFSVGASYANGTGVTKDEKEAVRWYTLAAEHGHADAQYNLGLCYANGTGVTKDEKEAVRLYTLAAAQGHAGAQYHLGSA